MGYNRWIYTKGRGIRVLIYENLQVQLQWSDQLEGECCRIVIVMELLGPQLLLEMKSGWVKRGKRGKRGATRDSLRAMRENRRWDSAFSVQRLLGVSSGGGKYWLRKSSPTEIPADGPGESGRGKLRKRRK